VWRETASEARDSLARRGPDERIETMREALAVWNPFINELFIRRLDTAYHRQS
jgi:hypothetical protein